MKITTEPLRALTGFVLLSVVGLTQTPAALVGQSGIGESRSILELLPLQASALAVGSEVSGTLSETDYRTTNGVLVQAFALEGGAGDPITVDLISDDFDAYLFLVGPGYEEPLTDDDSGGACHARLTLFLPENGPYRLVVGSWQSPGSYTLTVDSRAHPPAPGDCSGDEFGGEFFDTDMLAALTRIQPTGTLQPGVEIEGTLSDEDADLPDDSRAEVWTLAGEPGQTLVVELISQSFDALLMRVPPERDRYEMDDDSAGNCNSRMWVTFEGSEPHLIIANSLGPDGRGAFTLRVSDSAGPEAPGAC
jgi:hypothetical protein